MSLETLRQKLTTFPEGSISEARKEEVLNCLSLCWNELPSAKDTSMQAYKLNRMESPGWQPPCLTFEIERHGAASFGSKKAEMQIWSVNVETGEVSHEQKGYRMLEKRDPPLKVEPLADEIRDIIKHGVEDKRLKWYSADKVKLEIANIIPDNAAKQTVSGRRKRFSKALQERLVKDGWGKISPQHVYERKQST